jgi:phosphoadenosine phosphosulfate reductase
VNEEAGTVGGSALSPDAVHKHAAELRGASPEAILRWTLATFPQRSALTVSFGGGGLVLAHLLSQIDRSVPVLFLDTGFHFPETLTFKDAFVARYGLNLVELHPATDPGPLYQTDPDRCCSIRKVEPLERALVEGAYQSWISAVRSDQSQTRTEIDVLEYHRIRDHSVVKVYPLAGWSRDQVKAYLREHEVPYHPLMDQGFTSIGCWPCTRATRPGEPERAGRWSGLGKTECGIHTFTEKV